MFKRKILLAESDHDIRVALENELVARGYDVIAVHNGRMAKEIAESHCPDLVLLSSVLADEDGLSVLRMLRSWSCVPVIWLVSEADEREIDRALEIGANDCIFRPYGMTELMSRIKIALRDHVSDGAAKDGVHSSRYQVGSLVIDYDRYRAYVAGKDALLTQNEFRIVALLGKFAGKVLSYDYIIRQLWGPNAQSDNQILRVNMANIRRKIEKNTSHPRYIITVSGVGYLMADE
ncbi:MAG: response regulator transcription factor [Oscillospiraceae bacterium]|nr:response regulator transcription factor [Oscillospiraceae bacterium]